MIFCKNEWHWTFKIIIKVEESFSSQRKNSKLKEKFEDKLNGLPKKTAS